MSDTPKATKMTLEEAVEIMAKGRYQFAITAECDISDDAHPKFKKKAAREAFAKWDRARAIVDQAVKAHKAACHTHDGAITYEYWTEFKKLRALERGEGSEGKP